MSRIGVATGRVSCLLFSLLILLSGHSCQPRASTRSDAYGVTPLMRACFRGNLKLARLLIEKGANPNARTRYGFTPLIYAASSGNAAVAKLLLEHGAEVNVTVGQGESPLMEAVSQSNRELAAAFLDQGADANVETESGLTSLMMAAKAGDLHMAKLLVRHGADHHKKVTLGKKWQGFTAIIFAQTNGHAEVEAYLKGL